MAARRRLLARGMSFQPDAVIANGDQIYWDMTTAMARVEPKYVREQIWGRLGSWICRCRCCHPKNLPIFIGICDYQISGLYGTTLRIHAGVLPDRRSRHVRERRVRCHGRDPAAGDLRHARCRADAASLLSGVSPDGNRPAWLPGGDKAWAPSGPASASARCATGTSLETVFYDCRRYVNSMERPCQDPAAMGRRLGARADTGRRYRAFLPRAVAAIRVCLRQARRLVSGFARRKGWANGSDGTWKKCAAVSARVTKTPQPPPTAADFGVVPWSPRNADNRTAPFQGGSRSATCRS